MIRLEKKSIREKSADKKSTRLSTSVDKLKKRLFPGISQERKGHKGTRAEWEIQVFSPQSVAGFAAFVAKAVDFRGKLCS
ncbi:hypothetical protein [Geoalkalibacter sp.]|uniref:hypothetical protein n=1 Tax=Geoalkalibacter sp. TaxID=3041440 RepID=UPI00272E64B6|nr:hypothetical protein [Geoalkalibacter sp.]